MNEIALSKINKIAELPFEAPLWFAVHEKPMPKKFITHYMEGTGNPLIISKEEMGAIKPKIDMRWGSEYIGFKNAARLVRSKQKEPVVYKNITFSGPAKSAEPGTLGQFTYKYSGSFVFNTDDDWKFEGSISFYDYWNFDPKFFWESNRSFPAEVQTWVAGALMRGKPYEVNSVWVPIVITPSNLEDIWK